MALSTDPPRRTQRVVIPLTVLVGVVATAVAYLGTREYPQARPAPPPAAAADLPVQTIVLPHVEPDLPPGPHRETFIRYCTLCHGARLVLTDSGGQPVPERRVGPRRAERGLEVLKRGREGLRHVAAAVGTEAAALIRHGCPRSRHKSPRNLGPRQICLHNRRCCRAFQANARQPAVHQRR